MPADPKPLAQRPEALYRRYGSLVFRRAMALLRSEAEALEVMQDVFLSLVENPAQFSQQSRVSTFLYAATTHACLNHMRNRDNRRRLRLERSQELEQQHDFRLLSAEQSLALKRALRQMPEDLAEVAIYRFLDGMSHEEIATALRCSRRHVGNLLARLRRWAADHAPDASPAVPAEGTW